MNFRIVVFHLPSLALVLCCAGALYAQNFKETSAENPYYIEFSGSDPSAVAEIQNHFLSLRYNDRHGKESDLVLRVYDWKRVLIAQYQMRKTFGVNYFNIDLEQDVQLETGRIYSCEAVNEGGRKLVALFKLVSPIRTDPPQINIVVNPVSFDCNDPLKNSVEFYADIKGGRPPYAVNWYVMNRARTNFLYQPRKELVSRPGNTPAIFVDSAPDYYVMLLVQDACGMESRQMVNLTCGEKNKKVNTIFVEPLDALPVKRKGFN